MFLDRKIISKVLENDSDIISNKIDFSSYNKGVYFVNLISNDQIVLSRMVSYVN